MTNQKGFISYFHAVGDWFDAITDLLQLLGLGHKEKKGDKTIFVWEKSVADLVVDMRILGPFDNLRQWVLDAATKPIVLPGDIKLNDDGIMLLLSFAAPENRQHYLQDLNSRTHEEFVEELILLSKRSPKHFFKSFANQLGIIGQRLMTRINQLDWGQIQLSTENKQRIQQHADRQKRRKARKKRRGWFYTLRDLLLFRYHRD